MNINASAALISNNQNLTVQNATEFNKQISEISTNDVESKDEHSDAIQTLLSRLPELDNCFKIHGKIGEGTFSNVYLASLKGFSSKKRYAIKHLIPTSHPKRMEYELDCLNRLGYVSKARDEPPMATVKLENTISKQPFTKKLKYLKKRGKDNVVSCEMTMRQADCVVFIMPYLQHQKFADYVLSMTVSEARLYMKNLLLSLRRVHSFNIIHRDIKPSNFLYNRESKRFLLVDFGLAQKVNEPEDSERTKPLVSKITATKRKREDDDLENMETPMVKRCALQTLSNDMINKQGVRSSASLRYSKQPLSIQQQKSQKVQAKNFQQLNPYTATKDSKLAENVLKRQPLTSNATNVISNSCQKVFNQKQTFQNLMPQKVLSLDSGASFIRVQNSQVQPGPLFPKPTGPVRRKDVCQCIGKPQVCSICLTRKAQYAPRAGTPGFRPPEVLLKYPHQTTAVDMWSAGVIMLCILSGCYPFFRSPDDITALCELITVFGSSPIMDLAKQIGRNVICKENRKPVNLRLLCETLRRRKLTGYKIQPIVQPLCPDCHHSNSPEYGCLCEDKCKLDLSQSFFPSSAIDLLSKLLDVNPDTRISAELALQHPFILGD